MSGKDKERWRRVDGILEAVLELPAGERDAFLERTCGGDADLRREVDSLLAHDRTDAFLATPAASEAARLLVAAQPLVGQRIGAFEVLAAIGTGGMGEVYVAQDTRLQRRVALKRIPAHLVTNPERVLRFRREALATSALNHPNIVTVHEIIEHQDGDLLVTELVDGVSLRERLRDGALPLSTALDIALQVARGLAAAHAVGIVHRDVKPENVMVRRDGLVKVLDFGIAKSPPQLLTDPESATTPGALIGTVGYMSPEQVRGLPVDARTDVWSLGVVLYELVTGESAFPGVTPGDRLAAILEREPEPPSRRRPGVPVALDNVIARALTKNAAGRHTDALELAADLERLRLEGGEAIAPPPRRQQAWWRAGIAAAVALTLAVAAWLAFESMRRAPDSGADKLPRLAVLPFEDLGAPEDSYFAAGMTEELIGGLAAVHGLEVISRTTVTQYSRTGKRLREIGHDLGVDYVLEGTVRWDRGRPGEDRVRISPQLIRVSDDTHLWAEEYDRDLGDVFAVQSEIAGQVVRALGVTLSAHERRLIEVPPTRNPEAYQLYLRGLQMLNPRIPTSFGSNLLAGVDLMHRAAELDPGFVRAHTREAGALALIFFLGGPAENRERARAALARAQALAPDDPRVRLSAGWVYYHGARDYSRALSEFEAAGREMPSNEIVPFAIGSVLRRLGRYEEALDRFARASELGTSEGIASWFIDRDIAETNWGLRRYPEADRLYKQCLRVAANEGPLWSARTVLQLHWTGDTADARGVLADAPPTLSAQLVESRVLIELWDRHFARAVALAQPHLDPRQVRPLEWYVAYADLRLGRSQEAADLARRLIAAPEEKLAANPESAPIHLYLAQVHALVGAAEPALTHARKAVELTANDAFMGPQAVEILAKVYTLLGDREQALALLPGLLDKAYFEALSVSRLQGEPWWDPLRGDPRFEQLLAHADAGSPSPGAPMPPAH
ncbi:MAG TPA: protein kinase [Thermoanaerobaculia bacterium]|nr:protein kinase [Thermoanaerobaculia bacterium]